MSLNGPAARDAVRRLPGEDAVEWPTWGLLIAVYVGWLFAASSKSPGDYKILPDVLRQEPYGIMLRKDDPQFKGLVDVTVRHLMKSGKINALYAKWFTSPIPPRGINLNFPMTDATAELYRNPTDKGI